MKIKEKYIDRFWSYVEVKDMSSCWNWKAGRKIDGYGVYNFFNGIKFVNEPAHRFAKKIYMEIPNSLCVLHTCDNRLCCNPSHLWVGTRKDNNLDRDKKGRHIALKGEKHGCHKLTNSNVLNIRILRDCGSTLSQVAELYKISKSMVWNISKMINWTHL